MEIYVSTDVESDGPIPGVNNLLSFGSAAFTANKKLVSTFTANLYAIEGGVADKSTMEWWKTQPEAWAACRKNLEYPEDVFPAYAKWLEQLPGKPVFVGYPAGYDFLFIYWYLIRFAGRSPFSFSALDIKSYAMAVLKKEYRQCTKKNFPKVWFDPSKHTHIALEDAIEQGQLFCNILKYHVGGQ